MILYSNNFKGIITMEYYVLDITNQSNGFVGNFRFKRLGRKFKLWVVVVYIFFICGNL